MKTIIIDRSKWRTGGDRVNTHLGITQLINDYGNMCCLGFFCVQSGIDSEKIVNISAPDTLTSRFRKLVPELVKNIDGDDCYHSDLSTEAIRINDSPELSNEEREERLTQLFKDHSIELIFENDYPLIQVH